MSSIRDKKIAVWFSCGAASAVALKKTVELYGADNEIIALNNPVKEEHHDNQRFLQDVAKWVGVEIVPVTNPKFPNQSIEDVFRGRKYMSGVKGAPCTLELKKAARQHWEKTNPVDYHVLGFTSEEAHRHARFTMTERDNVLPVLIDLGISKQDCFNIIRAAGINLPEIYSLGFPNANCIGCVKATSPTYWSLVREKFPEEFNARAKQSREIGCRLTRHKGQRIFLDELPVGATGRSLKHFDVECGIFCEEKPGKKKKK